MNTSISNSNNQSQRIQSFSEKVVEMNDIPTDVNVTHLYIPRMSREHTKEAIDVMFHCHRIGKLVSVDFVDLKVLPGATHNPNLVCAFIAVKFFTPEDCKKSHAASASIRDSGSYKFFIKNKSANPDEFWLLLPNKKPIARTERNIHQVAAHADEMQVKINVLEETVKQLVEEQKQAKIINDQALVVINEKMQAIEKKHADDMDDLRELLLRNLSRKCGMTHTLTTPVLEPPTTAMEELYNCIQASSCNMPHLPPKFVASTTNEHKIINADDMAQAHWNPEIRKQKNINEELRNRPLSENPLMKYYRDAQHMHAKWNNRDHLEENVDRWALLTSLGLEPVPFVRSVAFHGKNEHDDDEDLLQMELDAVEPRLELELTSADNVMAAANSIEG